MEAKEISLGDIESKIRDAYPNYDLYVIKVHDHIDSCGGINVLCYSSKDRRSITPADLTDLLSGIIDRDQIPRIVYRFESFPRTTDQSELRERLQKGLLQGNSLHISEC